MTNLEGWLITISSVVLGGLITWQVARSYYVRASRELVHESESLRKMASLVLKAFEEEGKEFNKNERGEFLGIVRNGSCPIDVTPGLKANSKSSRTPDS